MTNPLALAVLILPVSLPGPAVPARPVGGIGLPSPAVSWSYIPRAKLGTASELPTVPLKLPAPKDPMLPAMKERLPGPAAEFPYLPKAILQVEKSAPAPAANALTARQALDKMSKAGGETPVKKDIDEGFDGTRPSEELFLPEGDLEREIGLTR